MWATSEFQEFRSSLCLPSFPAVAAAGLSRRNLNEDGSFSAGGFGVRSTPAREFTRRGERVDAQTKQHKPSFRSLDLTQRLSTLTKSMSLIPSAPLYLAHSHSSRPLPVAVLPTTSLVPSAPFN